MTDTDTTTKDQDAEPSLLRCHVRVKEHVPGRVLQKFGKDNSGDIEYAFNAAGFRGEDYNPHAKFKLCVIGESHAFGSGVKLEDTFGHRVKQHIAAARGLNEADVNLVNLSVGGSSADYCARALYLQLSRIDVDLVILQLPSRDRIEYIGPKKTRSYNVTSANLNRLDKTPLSFQGFLMLYNNRFGVVNQLKNVMLIQNLMKSTNTDLIVTTHDLVLRNTTKEEALPFVGHLNYRQILRHKYFQYRADLAKDNSHAGPRCHGALAVTIMKHYAKRVVRTKDTPEAVRINTYVENLLAKDTDVAFCNDFIKQQEANS